MPQPTKSDIDTRIIHPGDKMPHSCSVMDLLDNKSTSNKKKTPQEFLGENSKLVNFENLVPIPKAG